MFGSLFVVFWGEQLDLVAPRAWPAAGVVRVLRFLGRRRRRDLDGGMVALHSFRTLWASRSGPEVVRLVDVVLHFFVAQVACVGVVVGGWRGLLLHNGVGGRTWSGA